MKCESTPNEIDSSSNLLLFGLDEEAMPEIGSTSSRPSSRGSARPQRRVLQFLQLSELAEEESTATGGSSGDDDDPLTLYEVKANEKVAKDTKGYFSLRKIDEPEDYLTELPSGHHHRPIGKVVSKATESRETDGRLIAAELLDKGGGRRAGMVRKSVDEGGLLQLLE